MKTLLNVFKKRLKIDESIFGDLDELQDTLDIIDTGDSGDRDMLLFAFELCLKQQRKNDYMSSFSGRDDTFLDEALKMTIRNFWDGKITKDYEKTKGSQAEIGRYYILATEKECKMIRVLGKSMSSISYNLELKVTKSGWSNYCGLEFDPREYRRRRMGYRPTLNKKDFGKYKWYFVPLSTMQEMERLSPTKYFKPTLDGYTAQSQDEDFASPEYTAELEKIEQEILSNNEGKNMFTVEPINMSLTKLTKLDKDGIRELLKDKSLVIYLPKDIKNIHWLNSWRDIKDMAKDIREETYNDQDVPTIMVVKLYDGYQFNITLYGMKIDSYGRIVSKDSNRYFNDFGKFIKAIADSVKDKSSYGFKVFIVDAFDPRNYGLNTFFKPFVDIWKKSNLIRKQILKKFEAKFKNLPTYKINDNRSGYGSESWPWNFVGLDFGGWDLLLVGKNEGIGMSSSGNHPIVKLDKVAPWTNSSTKSYKVTTKQYEEFKKYLLDNSKAYDEAQLALGNFVKEWADKYILGKVPDPKAELEAEKEEIKDDAEQEAKENPNMSNDPNAGSEPVKIAKGKFDKALDKMTAWHEGKRKQNVKSCSPDKLRMYYKVCVDLGYDKEAQILADEMKLKNVPLPKVDESYIDIANCIFD